MCKHDECPYKYCLHHPYVMDMKDRIEYEKSNPEIVEILYGMNEEECENCLMFLNI